MRYLEHRHLIAGQRQHLSYEQRMAEVKAAALRELPHHKQRLNMLLECKAADFQIQNCDSKIVLEQKDFASVAASVPYLYYRLGYSSPQVAEQLSLKPPHVRQIIYRMNKIAVAIEEGKVWHRFSGQHRPPPSNECQKTIVQLYKGGMKVAAIARQVGVTSLMARRLLIRAKLIHSQTGWAA